MITGHDGIQVGTVALVRFALTFDSAGGTGGGTGPGHCCCCAKKQRCAA
jgi:hypothetical protein